MTTTELHALRSAQLKALHSLPELLFSDSELERVWFYANICGARYDTRNLSDKALEEIQTLASKYLEQIA